MKERLLEFLKAENKSSAQLAEEIGVQPSGISHILSGRNNPSLDFVLKMLNKYRFISTDWLLFGRGTMYKDIKMQSLFDEVNMADMKIEASDVQNETEVRQTDDKYTENDLPNINTVSGNRKIKSSVSRIVMFYDDSSFEEYFPRE
jgi:transcriptional regulator with XRE-family HTH domain